MSKPSDYGLPYPFRPCDDEPYLNIEIGPGECVRVVTAGVYDQMISAAHDHVSAAERNLDQLRIRYAALQAEYDKLRQAAVEQIEAAQHLVDIWEHFGNAT